MIIYDYVTKLFYHILKFFNLAKLLKMAFRVYFLSHKPDPFIGPIKRVWSDNSLLVVFVVYFFHFFITRQSFP